MPDANCDGCRHVEHCQSCSDRRDGAAGPNPDRVPAGLTANDGTFGESAIDLTSIGVLSDTGCDTFTAGPVVFKTGESDGAQLIDIMGMPPIEISNCNQVDVEKVGNTPGLELDDTFNYQDRGT